ncbi:hypothetical protein [Caballeronia hypogeia]|nr:hypothetical protein [Caballeronia hypogeia]
MLIERDLWSAAIFNDLSREFDQPRRMLAMLPEYGYRTIPIVPALLAIGVMSTELAQICIAYIDAQRSLIQRNVTQAMQRRCLDDRPMTQTLRSFADALVHARVRLAELPPRAVSAPLVRKAEAWLLG